MCVVDLQPGPNICLAINFQDAVFPTPAGPVIKKLGGVAEILAEVSAWHNFSGIARASNV